MKSELRFTRILFYFWKLARNYKIAILSLFVFSTGRSILTTVVGGIIYKNIIDTLNQPYISTPEKYVIVVGLLVPMSISFITSLCAQRYVDFVKIRFVNRMVKDMYDFCFSRVYMHSYTFFSNTFGGSLVTKIKRFARAFEVMLEVTLFNFWLILVIITATSIALFSVSKVLGLYVIGWAIIYACMTLIFVRQKIKLDLLEAEADSRLTGVLSDGITNVLNIKIFSAFRQEFAYFQEVTSLVRSRSYISSRFSIIRNFTQAFFMVVFHIFILYTMMGLWRDGVISVGVFVMAYTYMLAIFDRIWDLAQGVAQFMKATTEAKEMVDILDLQSDIVDPTKPQSLFMRKGLIAFHDVTFKYLNGASVFENLNVNIPAGQKVGIVGHSGAGKSTITKLLLRFADVTEGAITIDGQDIRNVTQDDLRSAITYVPQEPLLFHRSIYENIAYGNPNASKEEVIAAARAASAHEFIERLQDGYDTLVGERGVKLSGGERQRVAIARAMLKQAPILILDEATSSLDSESEAHIQKALATLIEGKTALVIAHRLSTIQKMDRILVFEEGEIVEDGTHAELTAKNGVYANLWNHQVGGFIVE